MVLLNGEEMRESFRSSHQRDRRFNRSRRISQTLFLGAGLASGVIVSHVAADSKVVPTPTVQAKVPTAVTTTTSRTRPVARPRTPSVAPTPSPTAPPTTQPSAKATTPSPTPTAPPAPAPTTTVYVPPTTVPVPVTTTTVCTTTPSGHTTCY